MHSKFSDLDMRAFDHTPGYYELLTDMIYKDGSFSYVVEEGFVTDLASIPWFLRWVFSKNGLSSKPAVMHDHMYTYKWHTRKECDQMFYIALLSEGVSKWKAKMYYQGVRAFGWYGNGNW